MESRNRKNHENRSYFLVTIPCHKDLINTPINLEGDAKKEGNNKLIKKLLKSELENLNLQVKIAANQNIDIIIKGLENLILQVYLQVWNNSREDINSLLKTLVSVLVKLDEAKECSAHSLLQLGNRITLYKLRKYIIAPGMSAGYIELVNPDKPTSSKQAYRLTEKGRNLFKT